MSLPRGKAPEDAAVAEGEVAFHEVDPLHVVWHGRYYEYMEHARMTLFRRHRIDALDLIPLGLKMFVIESECRHVAPLRYGERWRAKAWFSESAQRIGVSYEITSGDGRRVARGRTLLVTTDPEGGLLLETPAVLRERIESAAAPSKA
ncbi:MAG: acyl-CoA thioesterase [Sandaracinaceae bacterium]|nr:acyl-CoA thioesterase [Sandaracinaceae bacterium]